MRHAARPYPYQGRCTPVNAWWGSFDLAVSLFCGVSAEPPSDDGWRERVTGLYMANQKILKRSARQQLEFAGIDASGHDAGRGCPLGDADPDVPGRYLPGDAVGHAG
jgi:Family of unknown function (DUF5996)